MVFNVSSTVQPKVDVEKPVVNEWEATSDKSLLVGTRHAKKSGACCTALPWFLLFICIILLAGVSCWGWKEHKKFQDLLHCKTTIPSHLVMSQGETLSPLLINDPVKIPYGNDALDPAPENDQGDGENDVIEHDDPESSDGDDSGVGVDTQGDPETTPKSPFHFVHFRFPFHFPILSDDGDRVRGFRYRLRFHSLFNPENEAGSGED